METIFEKFREYLRLRSFAPVTIESRLRQIRYFYRFIQLTFEINDLTHINSRHIEEYRRFIIEYVNQRGAKDKPCTINTRVKAVRLFLKFLYEEDLVAQNLVKYLPYVREPKSLPSVVLEDKEVKKILQECDTNTVLGYRDRTILEVFYSSGIRKSELRNLKVDDADTENGYLRVNQGKGGKDRVVPLGKIASHYVENYRTGLRRFLLNGKEDPGWLFLSSRGNKTEETTLGKMIKKTVKRAGIEKNVSSHTFRRSCATEMIKNNANLVHVKDILGHSDFRSIQVYARLTITDLKKAHQKYHPREKIG